MICLFETTDYGDNTPNHTYIMEDNDKTMAIGYLKFGEGEPFIFKKPIRLNTKGRTFVKLKNQ